MNEVSAAKGAKYYQYISDLYVSDLIPHDLNPFPSFNFVSLATGGPLVTDLWRHTIACHVPEEDC